MENVKHTPGPWKVVSYHIHGDDGTVDCNCLPANKRLIAAAPELLEACVDMVGLFKAWQNSIFKKVGVQWTNLPPAIEKAEDAIANAKAEGIKP